MYYTIENNKLIRCVEPIEGNPNIVLEEYKEGTVPKNKHNIASSVFNDVFSHYSFHFESRDGFDLLCMRMKSVDNFSRKDFPIYIFLKSNSLIIYAVKTERIEERLDTASKNSSNIMSLGEVVYQFMNMQINEDLKYLESFENEFTKIEERVFDDDRNDDYIHEFISVREKIRRIKLYYEQFLNILNDIEANENGLFDKHSVKQFRILSRKTERLYTKTISLMDYISEIRSAYQAEVELSLNKTMKVLTVISVVVLPLTLIVGWYGMNFDMPEYNSPYGYPVMVGLSILSVTISILYFRKHNI